MMPAAFTSRRDRFLRLVARDLWVPDLAALPWYRRVPLKLARVAYLTAKGFRNDGCFLRASALTYITVLSIVPLLALAFSVAKSLGVYAHLRGTSIVPFLDRVLGPTGPGQDIPLREAVDKILELVERTDVANLGLLGLLTFMWAAVRLLGAVEGSFNVIWGVGKSRSWPRKIADYLTLVLITPLFLVIAATLTTAAQSAPLTGFVAERLHLGEARDEMIRLLPHLAVWSGFTFIYLALPNARVRISSAILGGVLGGALWQIALVLHIHSQVDLARYNAVYSSFAALPVFLVWLYASWAIVLFGAELACAHQSEPAYRQIALSHPTDHAFRSVVALRAMTRIARAFIDGAEPLRPSRLAEDLALPVRMVNESLAGPLAHGLLARAVGTSEEPYLLARDPSAIRVCDVLDALRGTAGPVDVPSAEVADHRIDRVLAALDDATRGSPHNHTLREMAAEGGDGAL